MWSWAWILVDQVFFIKMVSRDYELFKRAPILVASDGKGNIKTTILSRPSNIIVCDGCSSRMDEEKIGLLMHG